MSASPESREDIIRQFGVTTDFNPGREIERRIIFLKDYLLASGMRTYVLGISGGVDSLTAGLLAQEAVRRLRQTIAGIEFIAVRLPYGVQADEDDAQKALAVIVPDRTMTIDIKEAADSILQAAVLAGLSFADGDQRDFVLGNIKARQRMIAQYTLAGALQGLVIGTDHAAEAVMGFFTKHGDGAADILPLAGLTKRQVRSLASMLGAPDELVFKVPTADLETNRPQRPDEDAHGVTYEQIDDFLEGKPVEDEARQRILSTFRTTAHKRALPVAANEIGLSLPK
ncbi:NAD+ synthase [Rhizobium sp. PP-F2F-G36]|nr:NAD+ synthase [Rhizobium sp. PP-F2F-G36]